MCSSPELTTKMSSCRGKQNTGGKNQSLDAGYQRGSKHRPALLWHGAGKTGWHGGPHDNSSINEVSSDTDEDLTEQLPRGSENCWRPLQAQTGKGWVGHRMKTSARSFDRGVEICGQTLLEPNQPVGLSG
jgi:hypothetical protein